MLARLRYVLRSAWRGLARSPLRSLLSAGSIGVTLGVLGAYVLLYLHFESFLSRWGGDLDLSIYLADAVTSAERADLETYLRARPDVAEIRYTSKEAARERLRREWPAFATLLAEHDDDLAEASFEVRLRPVADVRAALAALARDVARRPGVSGTEFGEVELARVEDALAALRSAGAILGGLLGFAALFVVGATIRLALRERGHELEIMRLCGATNAFIRAPLFLEGALQGALGGAVALGLVAGLHAAIEGALGGLAPHGLSFLSADIAALFLGGSAMLGALGSAVAARRHLRA